MRRAAMGEPRANLLASRSFAPKLPILTKYMNTGNSQISGCLMVAAAGFLVLFAATTASYGQADLTWDITPGTVGPGNTEINEGAGVWDALNGNWTEDTGNNNVAFASWDDVTFGGGTGTAGPVFIVNGSAGVEVNSLTFDSPGSGEYTISGETIKFGNSNTDGRAKLITTNGGNPTISSTLTSGSGTGILNFGATADGIIQINADNSSTLTSWVRLGQSDTGNLTVRALQDGALGASSNRVILQNTGTRLELADSVTLGNTISIANVNGQKTLAVAPSATSATISGNLILEDDSDGDFNVHAGSGQTLTLSGAISNDGNGPGIDKTGAGTVVLKGSSISLSARTSLENGTLVLDTGNNVALGNLLRDASDATATLQVNSGTTTTISGNVGFGGSRTLILDSDATNTGSGVFDASLAASNGDGNLRVDGGNWTLNSNDNNMAGSYTVNDGGTLLVDGTISSNATTITVNNGGTLGGTGTINDSVTVNSGGTLTGSVSYGGTTTIEGIHSPGNSPGLENQTNLVYNDGSTFTWELINNTTSGPGTNFDRVQVSNNLTFNGTVNLVLDFNAATGSNVDWYDPFWGYNIHEWQIWGVGNSTTGFPTLSGGPGSWTDGTRSFQQAILDGELPQQAQLYLFQDGNSIYLRYEAALPEPTTFGLLGLVLAGLTSVVRPKRRMG